MLDRGKDIVIETEGHKIVLAVVCDDRTCWHPVGRWHLTDAGETLKAFIMEFTEPLAVGGWGP